MSREYPKALTFDELMALKVEPKPCSWEGCKEKAKKHCRFPLVGGERCRGQSYCAHHFYRHLDKEHPEESELRGGAEIKKQQ